MRSKVQATTREEKRDRWLDSGGVMRKHEAGKGTAREGWGQAVPQRWRKKQQKQGEGAGQRPTKEDGSRMEMQKTCNRQQDREEGKKNRGRDLDQESWAQAKKKAAKTKKEAMKKSQRGRNETRTGSWDSKQWREVARGGNNTKQTT